MLGHATLSSVAGLSSTTELRSAWAMPSIADPSADIADDDKSRLCHAYPALKPERGVKNALHAMNGKGPFIFGAAMGVDLSRDLQSDWRRR